jgi:hypothetical protein
MQFKVQNTTTDKTIWVDNAAGWNALPLGPGQIVTVSDTGKDELLSTYPDYITVIGTTIDDSAPVQVTIPLTATWTLYDMGEYCTTFRFFSTDASTLLSFSGWDTSLGQTAPPTLYQLSIPSTGDWLELNMTMNPSRVFYAKGTGTLTIIGL